MDLRKGKIIAIKTDLAFLPEELHAIYNVEKAQKYAAANARKQVSFSFGDTLAKLEKLDDEHHPSEEKEEEEDEPQEDFEDEDDLEDDTDYNLSYFDNGEDYGGGDYDDGGGDDGPVY